MTRDMDSKVPRFRFVNTTGHSYDTHVYLVADGVEREVPVRRAVIVFEANKVASAEIEVFMPLLKFDLPAEAVRVIGYDPRTDAPFPGTAHGSGRYIGPDGEPVGDALPMTVPEDQPPPTPNTAVPVWELVVADMQERNRVGIERYGTPLQVFNGRDALQDAYFEALDLVVYLRQAIEERDIDGTVLRGGGNDEVG